VAKPPNAPPPPSTDGANRLYHQLAEIHAIATAQLAECACWHRTSPTPNTAYAGASGWGHYGAHRDKGDVDVFYAALQVHGIVNVALHHEYSPGIVFIFSQERKDHYHV
jgi:hypothetical protein